MGLKKAYDELTDNPEFSDGLTLGGDIVDTNGVSRFQPNDVGTVIFNDNGEQVLYLRSDANVGGDGFHRIYAQENSPIQIYDNEGDFIAVQYNTSSSAPGTLELTNANLSVPKIDIRNLSLGNTSIYQSTEYSSGAITETGVQETQNVDNTGSVIYSGPNPSFGSLLLVIGEEGSGTRFSDIVTFIQFDTATVIGSEESGSPSSRTYTVNEQDLELTMASGTYNVIATGTTGAPQT